MLDTVVAIAAGFGEIMTKVGLLIGFSVLLGALMHSLGALQRQVEVLRCCSARNGCRTR